MNLIHTKPYLQKLFINIFINDKKRLLIVFALIGNRKIESYIYNQQIS